MSEIKEKQQNYILSKPMSVTNTYKKAYEGSKANAVKAKCLDCTCDQREEIRDCEAFTCPLWEVRPYQVKRK
jgi:hypothetical protein